MTPQQLILGEEGGLASVPGDHGGLTSIGGQTKDWLEGVLGHPVSDAYMRAMTPAIAAENIGLWLKKTGLAQLLQADGGMTALAAEVIDYAYQSGEGRAIPVLQKILGVSPTAPHVGLATMTALAFQDRGITANKVHADREAFEGRLIERDWETAKATVQKTLTDHGVEASVVSTVAARMNAMQAKFAAGWLVRLGGLLTKFPR